MQFYLTNFTDTESLENAIRNIPYCDENTNTSGALRLTRTQIFNTANGDRPDVPNVIVLVTDGNPTIETDMLPGELHIIRRMDVRVVGVGVTNEVSDCAATACSSSIYLYKLKEYRTPLSPRRPLIGSSRDFAREHGSSRA